MSFTQIYTIYPTCLYFILFSMFYLQVDLCWKQNFQVGLFWKPESESFFKMVTRAVGLISTRIHLLWHACSPVRNGYFLVLGQKGSYPTEGVGNSNGGNTCSLTRHLSAWLGFICFTKWHSAGVSKDQNSQKQIKKVVWQWSKHSYSQVRQESEGKDHSLMKNLHQGLRDREDVVS